MDATNDKYYMPTEVSNDYFTRKDELGEPYEYVSEGRINLIDALYTNYSQIDTKNSSDPYNLTNRPQMVN